MSTVTALKKIDNLIYCLNDVIAAKEIGNFGIKVSCIMPGMTNTDMINDHTELKDKMITNKMIQPTDIAHAINYILTCPDTCCPLEMFIVPQYQYISKL